MSRLEKRYSAHAVLNGPDWEPATNPTRLAADFRRSTAHVIATPGMQESLPDSVPPAVEDLSNPVAERMRAETTKIGLRVSRSA